MQIAFEFDSPERVRQLLHSFYNIAEVVCVTRIWRQLCNSYNKSHGKVHEYN